MGTAAASAQVGSSAVAGASDANGSAASLAVSIAISNFNGLEKGSSLAN
jgi:hypothetical protein